MDRITGRGLVLGVRSAKCASDAKGGPVQKTPVRQKGVLADFGKLAGFLADAARRKLVRHRPILARAAVSGRAAAG